MSVAYFMQNWDDTIITIDDWQITVRNILSEAAIAYYIDKFKHETTLYRILSFELSREDMSEVRYRDLLVKAYKELISLNGFDLLMFAYYPLPLAIADKDRIVTI